MRHAPSRREPWHSSIEAMEEAFAAGDLERALGVVRERPERFLEWGPDIPLDRLETWLDALEHHAPEDPWLLYCRAWAWSTQRNHTLALVTLKRAEQRFAATFAPGTDELRRAGFLVAVAEGTIAEREGLYEEAGRAFVQALELAGLHEPPPPSADEERWAAKDQSGFFAFGLRALHLYREAGLALPAARIYHNLGTRLVDRGEPLPARAFLEQARELKAASGNRLAMANTLNSLGHVERQLGLFERARAHLQQALALAEELGHAWLRAYALNNLAEVERDAGSFESALELYAASLAIKHATENVFGLAHSYASLADLHLMAGDAQRAFESAAKAVKLRVPGPDRLENARLLSCQARARLAHGHDPEEVADELEALLRELSALDAKAEMVLAALWRSVALRRASDERRAVTTEHEAVVLAARFGLDRFLAPYLSAAQRSVAVVAEAPPRPGEYAQGDLQLPFLAANLLGALHVTVDGQELDVAGWRSRKAATLLMLLLHARGRTVHREEAIEALWPDAGLERASKHLNVAVSTVRRGLAAGHPAGPQCVQRIGESYHLRPDVLGRIDVVQLERLAELAERHEQEGDIAAAVVAADKALALSDRGEYMAELPYAAWAAAERERLRLLIMNLRIALAEWHLRQRQTRQAVRRANEVVAREPWHESAWHVLIRAHREAGDRGAALQALSECRRALKRELGVNPSEPLLELADSLGG